MKKEMWLSALFLSAMMLMFFASPVVADDKEPVSEDDVNEIAEQLYCPVCENVPLDVCPTQACADWRAVIREMLEEGKSSDEIIEYFSAQYGWSVLPMPPKVGLNWLIYVLPPAIILGTIALLLTVLRIGKRESKPLSNDAPLQESKNLGEYLAMIDRDLKDDAKNG